MADSRVHADSARSNTDAVVQHDAQRTEQSAAQHELNKRLEAIADRMRRRRVECGEFCGCSLECEMRGYRRRVLQRRALRDRIARARGAA